MQKLLFLMILAVPLISFAGWQEEVLLEFQNFYGPSRAPQNGSIEFVLNKKSELVSAGADGTADKMKILLEGGLWTSPRLNADGLRMMICHEIGHLLGGAPRKNIPPEWNGPVASDGNSMMSSEGQADYYASRVCFREIVKGHDHKEILKSAKIPQSLKSKCAEAHGANSEAEQICLRAALGGLNMLQVVKDFEISFDTPDDEIVNDLQPNTYPSRQCRLDTMVAGALCAEKSPLQLDFFNPQKNDCQQKTAQRPGCWYPR